MKSRLSSFFVLCLVGLAVASFLATTRVYPALQMKRRSIGRLPSERDEPLRLRAVKQKGKKIFNNQKLDDDHNWLKDLTIHVKNVSGKRILFAAIDLFFPATERGGPHAFDHVEYGNRQLLIRSSNPSEIASGIEPQQEVDIRLQGVAYERIRSLLTDVGTPDIARLNIRIGRVIFEDDTCWYAGSFFQRDGTQGRSWINIDDQIAQKNSRVKTLRAGVRSEAKGVLITKDGRPRGDMLANAIFFPFNSNPRWNSVFVAASYQPPPAPATTCYRVVNPQNIWCHLQPGCEHQKDYTDMIAGNYIIVSDQTSCTDNVSGNYCGLDSTTVAIQCIYGGGGGGGGSGGGGGGGENNTCSDDWDCDFGFSCTSEGFCEDDSLLNQ